MYGVVLWRDADGTQAVIWCDDHGDLALYRSADAEPQLEVGDLVSFRAEQSRRMRLAKDLQLVEQERFPGLPADLKAAGAAQASVRPDGEKIISLEKSRGKSDTHAYARARASM
jgi:hypothetical protein